MNGRTASVFAYPPQQHVRKHGPAGYKAEYQGLVCDYENLIYACNRCNSLKRDLELLDPGAAAFAEHLSLEADGRLLGLTEPGRELIRILELNQYPALDNRRYLLRVIPLLLTAPDSLESAALLQHLLGFPDDLPDLAALRPPSNSRPEGVADSYHRQRSEGRLPSIY